MVSLKDIQEQTNDLTHEEREGLLAYVVRGLKNPPTGPSAEEILERELEMDSGKVTTVSYDAFVAQANQR